MFGFGKTLLILIAAVPISSCFAQESFTENLNWVSTSTVSTDQSPTYSNASCSGIYYTLSSSSGLGFKYETGAANGSGVIFPGNTGTITTLPISIVFNTAVQNLAIHIRDLDEDNHHDGGPAEEYLANFSTVPSSVQSTGNPIFLSGGQVTPYDNTSSENNNTEGWIQWSGNIASLNFNYYRNSGTYEFIIDSIRFECMSGPDCTLRRHHYLSQWLGFFANNI